MCLRAPAPPRKVSSLQHPHKHSHVVSLFFTLLLSLDLIRQRTGSLVPTLLFVLPGMEFGRSLDFSSLRKLPEQLMCGELSLIFYSRPKDLVNSARDV
ncbi:hypothetical protein CDAR_121921 [Caerostris darwini]|uniref:Uncharacterized protein n=1 Tax=Caerostris darwini TaxID=1538125 RepID=A0AAV4R1N8_9ARAC|nr:hypothetical protein CDAR_121921 [Caerostris darwini]